MTTPTGTITFRDINLELGRWEFYTCSLNETSVRALAGKPSGAISLNDLRGKTRNFAIPLGISSNDGEVLDFGTEHQMTGYTGTPYIRVERYSYVATRGTFAMLKVDIYTGTSRTGPWTWRGSFDPRVATEGAYTYYDLGNIVPANSWIRYSVSGRSAGGRATAQWNMVIWDITNSVQRLTSTAVVIDLDMDNNYTPPAATGNPAFTISGYWNDTGWGEGSASYTPTSNFVASETLTVTFTSVSGIAIRRSANVTVKHTDGTNSVYRSISGNSPPAAVTFNAVAGKKFSIDLYCTGLQTATSVYISGNIKNSAGTTLCTFTNIGGGVNPPNSGGGIIN